LPKTAAADGISKTAVALSMHLDALQALKGKNAARSIPFPEHVFKI